MLRSLSTADKLELSIISLVILFCTSLVIAVISYSNGRDLAYFKERVVLMEYRMNALDKKQNDVSLRNETLVDKTNEVIKQTNDLAARQVEQDRWIEHWKSLPQLPKPPERKR